MSDRVPEFFDKDEQPIADVNLKFYKSVHPVLTTIFDEWIAKGFRIRDIANEIIWVTYHIAGMTLLRKRVAASKKKTPACTHTSTKTVTPDSVTCDSCGEWAVACQQCGSIDHASCLSFTREEDDEKKRTHRS